MSNLLKALKDEILRLARKEVRAQISKLKTDVVGLKKANASLKGTIAKLQKGQTVLLKAEQRNLTKPASIAPEVAQKARLTAKGVRALRKKLGLSQAAFGKLAGVSMGAVTMWEKKSGALKLRQATRTSILALRGIGAREAKRRLELVVTKVKEPKKAGK